MTRRPRPCWPTERCGRASSSPRTPSTPATAGSCPSSPPADISRSSSRLSPARWTRRGVRLPDLDGIAVTHGPGLVGSLLVGLLGGQGPRLRAPAPAGRREPPGRAHLRGPPRGPHASSRPSWRSSCPAATPRSTPRGPAPLPPGGADTGRRRRRGLRQGRQAPRARLPRRPRRRAHRAGGGPEGHRLPARPVPGPRAGLLVLGPQDRREPVRAPARAARRRAPSPTCAPRSRRRR